MPVPKEILAVERPKNTVVVPYGKDKNLYAVRQRSGCRYDHGRRLPVDGGTIGHIINGKYVPKISENTHSKVAHLPIDLKDWASVKLCDNISSTLLDDLRKVYDESDALKIYCAAILRVCNAGIKDRDLKDAYNESFLSEMYPGVALSRNTISVFWKNLGKSYSKIREFMCIRAEAIEAGHHVLIDGTLKSNESKVNSLSDYSRKAKTKGTRDISILYAYDLEAEEPICSKCFPGNMPDSTAYRSFLEENRIKQGIIIGDKGFPASAAADIFNNNDDLHYINPLKRNSHYIEDCRLFDYEGQLKGHETILYKKAKSNIKNEQKWLYSFRDTEQAHKEDYGWLHRASKEGKFDNNQYLRDWDLFGIIVLESDKDMDPITVYRAYESRWEIELVMRYYKQSCEFDETRVHCDYSVIGSELCSFLSSVITYRLLRKFDQEGLFEKYNYKQLMKILVRGKKVRIQGKEWELIKLIPSQESVLTKLGLINDDTP